MLVGAIKLSEIETGRNLSDTLNRGEHRYSFAENIFGYIPSFALCPFCYIKEGELKMGGY